MLTHEHQDHEERAWSLPIWYTPPQEVLIEKKLEERTGKKWGVTTYHDN